MPLAAALAAGKGGVSNVMHAGPNLVVAFAVPVRRKGVPVALVVAFADVRTWPLTGYNRTLELGKNARPQVLDASGVVAASGEAQTIGHRLSGLPTTSGRSGVVDITREERPEVLSYAVADFGWATVTEQPAGPFSADLRATSQRDALALIVLLTLVVLLLVWFHHKRHQVLGSLAEDRLHDPLTGLAQRRLFHIRMEAAVARHRRTGAPLSVLYCDLDAFKKVNDSYGHEVGDQLLVAVAARLPSPPARRTSSCGWEAMSSPSCWRPRTQRRWRSWWPGFVPRFRNCS